MNRRVLWGVLLVSLVLLAGTVTAAPLAFTQRRHVIAGGGSVVAQGDYRVWGTVGQPVTGWATGTRAAVCSGFWCTGSYRVYLPLVIRSNA